MLLSIGITLTVIVSLSGALATPIPAGRQPGDLVRVKPKDMTPVHPMGGNKAGLNNNHHAIVLGDGGNGNLRVTHVSSNPPKPHIHVNSVVDSVNIHGKIHIGNLAAKAEHVKDSNKFTGQRLTSDELAKIDLAKKLHKVAHDAAKHKLAYHGR